MYPLTIIATPVTRRLLSDKWKGFSPEEKAVWNEKHARLVEEYTVAVKEYDERKRAAVSAAGGAEGGGEPDAL